MGDTLITLLLQAAGHTRDVPGCELYIVNTAPGEEDVVWVTEIRRSEADHTSSLSAPGARELTEHALPLLAGAPERIDLTPVGGRGLGG
ncbi:antibiotic biosynthesis monooxygenase [Streptomyces sp. NPDC006552]|uniref:putative quinol monooxygenase n=1 Tax=Streptomyces sp. NPDC006552 TaxID=3157179 RepID=UPI0033BB4679